MGATEASALGIWRQAHRGELHLSNPCSGYPMARVYGFDDAWLNATNFEDMPGDAESAPPGSRLAGRELHSGAVPEEQNPAKAQSSGDRPMEALRAVVGPLVDEDEAKQCVAVRDLVFQFKQGNIQHKAFMAHMRQLQLPQGARDWSDLIPIPGAEYEAVMRQQESQIRAERIEQAQVKQEKAFIKVADEERLRSELGLQKFARPKSAPSPRPIIRVDLLRKKPRGEPSVRIYPPQPSVGSKSTTQF